MNTQLTLRKKIFTLTVLPILALGLVVILLSLTVVKGALVNEIKEALQSAATRWWCDWYGVCYVIPRIRRASNCD